MLVAMAILTIVSAIVIAGYTKMNNQLATSNLAYDIALVFRQAQVYSSSSKGSAELHKTVSSGKDVYGVRFASLYDNFNNISGENKFILFSENDNDGQDRYIDQYRCGTGTYLSDVPTDLKDCEASDEHDSTYNIPGRSKIKSFCVYKGVNEFCHNFDTLSGDILYADVSFYGPFVSSYIKTDIANDYDYLKVTVVSAYGDYERKVLIYKTGQIDVK